MFLVIKYEVLRDKMIEYMGDFNAASRNAHVTYSIHFSEVMIVHTFARKNISVEVLYSEHMLQNPRFIKKDCLFHSLPVKCGSFD